MPPTRAIGWSHFINSFWDPETWQLAAEHTVKIILIALCAWLISRLIRKLAQRAMRPVVESEIRRGYRAQAARHQTLGSLFQSLVQYAVCFFGLIAIIASWNIRALDVMSATLGTAGMLAVVVGFGAQKAVRDVVSGVLILVEDQYSVGDTVTIGTVTGVVEEVGIRITRIRDEIGRVNLVPNGDIAQVTNHSRGHLHAFVEVGVALDQDMDAVRNAVARIGEQVIAEDDSPIIGSVAVQGLTGMDGTKVTLRISGTAAPGCQSSAEMSLRSAVRDEFLVSGIKIV